MPSVDCEYSSLVVGLPITGSSGLTMACNGNSPIPSPTSTNHFNTLTFAPRNYAQKLRGSNTNAITDDLSTKENTLLKLYPNSFSKFDQNSKKFGGRSLIYNHGHGNKIIDKQQRHLGSLNLLNNSKRQLPSTALHSKSNSSTYLLTPSWNKLTSYSRPTTTIPTKYCNGVVFNHHYHQRPRYFVSTYSTCSNINNGGCGTGLKRRHHFRSCVATDHRHGNSPHVKATTTYMFNDSDPTAADLVTKSTHRVSSEIKRSTCIRRKRSKVVVVTPKNIDCNITFKSHEKKENLIKNSPPLDRDLDDAADINLLDFLILNSNINKSSFTLDSTFEESSEPGGKLPSSRINVTSKPDNCYLEKNEDQDHFLNPDYIFKSRMFETALSTTNTTIVDVESNLGVVKDSKYEQSLDCGEQKLLCEHFAALQLHDQLTSIPKQPPPEQVQERNSTDTKNDDKISRSGISSTFQLAPTIKPDFDDQRDNNAASQRKLFLGGLPIEKIEDSRLQINKLNQRQEEEEGYGKKYNIANFEESVVIVNEQQNPLKTLSSSKSTKVINKNSFPYNSIYCYPNPLKQLNQARGSVGGNRRRSNDLIITSSSFDQLTALLDYYELLDLENDTIGQLSIQNNDSRILDHNNEEPPPKKNIKSRRTFHEGKDLFTTSSSVDYHLSVTTPPDNYNSYNVDTGGLTKTFGPNLEQLSHPYLSIRTPISTSTSSSLTYGAAAEAQILTFRNITSTTLTPPNKSVNFGSGRETDTKTVLKSCLIRKTTINTATAEATISCGKLIMGLSSSTHLEASPIEELPLCLDDNQQTFSNGDTAGLDDILTPPCSPENIPPSYQPTNKHLPKKSSRDDEVTTAQNNNRANVALTCADDKQGPSSTSNSEIESSGGNKQQETSSVSVNTVSNTATMVSRVSTTKLIPPPLLQVDDIQNGDKLDGFNLTSTYAVPQPSADFPQNTVLDITTNTADEESEKSSTIISSSTTTTTITTKKKHVIFADEAGQSLISVRILTDFTELPDMDSLLNHLPENFRTINTATNDNNKSSKCTNLNNPSSQDHLPKPLTQSPSDRFDIWSFSSSSNVNFTNNNNSHQNNTESRNPYENIQPCYQYDPLTNQLKYISRTASSLLSPQVPLNNGVAAISTNSCMPSLPFELNNNNILMPLPSVTSSSTSTLHAQNQDNRRYSSASWIPEFTLPITKYGNYLKKLEEKLLSLENIDITVITNSYNDFRPQHSHGNQSSSIQTASVNLPTVVERRGFSLYGTARIKNVTFEKMVFVRATFDGWRHCRDYPCNYVKTGSSIKRGAPSNYFPYSTIGNRSVYAEFYGNREDDCKILRNSDLFEFEIQLPNHQMLGQTNFNNINLEVPLVSSNSEIGSNNKTTSNIMSLEFAICLKCMGMEYWDNNDGLNYKISLKLSEDTSTTQLPQLQGLRISTNNNNLLATTQPSSKTADKHGKGSSSESAYW